MELVERSIRTKKFDNTQLEKVEKIIIDEIRLIFKDLKQQ